MRKHTHRSQAPGIRADGEANRALRRAYWQGKPWAHEAVAEARRNLLKAWFIAARLVPGGMLYVPPAEDFDDGTELGDYLTHGNPKPPLDEPVDLDEHPVWRFPSDEEIVEANQAAAKRLEEGAA